MLPFPVQRSGWKGRRGRLEVVVGLGLPRVAWEPHGPTRAKFPTMTNGSDRCGRCELGPTGVPPVSSGQRDRPECFTKHESTPSGCAVHYSHPPTGIGTRPEYSENARWSLRDRACVVNVTNDAPRPPRRRSRSSTRAGRQSSQGCLGAPIANGSAHMRQRPIDIGVGSPVAASRRQDRSRVAGSRRGSPNRLALSVDRCARGPTQGPGQAADRATLVATRGRARTPPRRHWSVARVGRPPGAVRRPRSGRWALGRSAVRFMPHRGRSGCLRRGARLGVVSAKS
jgi:hypothetical protein